ncbi:metallophosphoesterase [Globicatella sulfidifaciens]|mgnify:CR=1 FL=1|uniref:Ser/Thr protein phosphatase n=1 Tax=Globicatella sulfidifaciens TaxID=136093 RepID=A0A7X8C5P3_9LACT|nr:metallophosphoesterase [Globicatella sulfidifaciens]NLJ19390.1 Ser/Thr protein phosphatase [Globicatella sulfidifaciens]
MAFVYAISDIHGYLQQLEETLSLVDLESDRKNKIILCGDYIDYGPESCKVLYRIRELVNSYPEQVIVLKGNHEVMFLEFLSLPNKDIQVFEWLSADKAFSTINTFLSEDAKLDIENLKIKSKTLSLYEFITKSIPILKEDIFRNHLALIEWLKSLPYYYETESQIFVHAGIDEEAEENWKWGTSDEYFVSKYPATFGNFYKDIIAGHISTSSLAKNRDYHDVYWDKKSHYFIDGDTRISGIIPILIYDTVIKKYTSHITK